MVAIPENEVSQKDLEEWYKLQQNLSAIKAAEMLLRTKIYKAMFKDPVEGTNSVPLNEGWVLKGKRTIQREIDAAALQANSAIDPATGVSRLQTHDLHVEQLIKWKPELVLKAYRLLSEEQLKIFDECLIIKDGSPALEIVLPAAARKAAERAPQEQDPANT